MPTHCVACTAALCSGICVCIRFDTTGCAYRAGAFLARPCSLRVFVAHRESLLRVFMAHLASLRVFVAHRESLVRVFVAHRASLALLFLAQRQRLGIGLSVVRRRRCCLQDNWAARNHRSPIHRLYSSRLRSRLCCCTARRHCGGSQPPARLPV